VNTPARIAIVEDEPDIAELVSLHLKKAGFQTAVFHNGESFSIHLKRHTPDLVILDLMLPDADGMEVCKALRKQERFAALPVLILSAKGEETDKVLGLELGADDYVTKPFSPRELVARVKALLRRKQEPPAPEPLTVGKILVLDPARHTVMASGKPVELTATEFKLLALLASRKGWVFSRDQLLDHLWGSGKAVVDRTVDVHIKNLREKLGTAGRFVKNVRGVGYKLEE
jgi:two-component system phosphate regulon response regulator PhoB/two-component system alkaline phosphatase synthesis response regulator PhoP